MVRAVHRQSSGYRNLCTRTSSQDSDSERVTKVAERSKNGRHTGEAPPRAEKFGELITADHKVLNEECELRNNHRIAVVVLDLAT